MLFAKFVYPASLKPVFQRSSIERKPIEHISDKIKRCINELHEGIIIQHFHWVNVYTHAVQFSIMMCFFATGVELSKK